MREKIFQFIIFTLLSITIFSTLSSNSYVYFKEHQEKMFIEDTVILKAFDGDIYKSVSDVVEMLNDNDLSYVLYYVKDDTYYTLVNGYKNMLSLKTEDGIVVSQSIGEYNYEPLDINSDTFEIFIAVENFSEEELIELFVVEETGFTDGMVALFTQGYEGMMSAKLFIIFIILIILINYMFLSLYLQTQKENVGIMKVLGYSTKYITKKYVKTITIFYVLSLCFVYAININYLNFVFNQIYVFNELLDLILIYILSVILSIFLCGVIIYYFVSKFSAAKFLSEVAYD